MSDRETCPHCNGDLRGAPIPQEYIDKGYYADGVTHYSRIIGVEIPGVYDGCLFWMCPDCGGRWHRFDLSDWPDMVRKAQPYIDGKEIGRG